MSGYIEIDNSMEAPMIHQLNKHTDNERLRVSISNLYVRPTIIASKIIQIYM